MMSTSLLERPLGEIARDMPGASAVFYRYKLDFCCGGALPLADAAQRKGLSADDLIHELETMARYSDSNASAVDVAALDDSALIAHILERYHAVHKEQLPELIRLASKVERVHGDHPLCPRGLAAHLQAMEHELLGHMNKEEQVLFPMISRNMGRMMLMPISVMRHEHEEHAAALAELDRLSHQQQLPEDACNSWRALYRNVDQLKRDLMEHMHLENNVLFARFDGRLGGAG